MSALPLVVPEIEEKYWPKPAGEWILAIIPEVAEKTAGGILMPEQTREFLHLEQVCAKVLRVGPDAYRVPTPAVMCHDGPYCAPGDWVIYALNQGQEVKVRADGKSVRFLLLHASHIRGTTDAPESTKSGLSR